MMENKFVKVKGINNSEIVELPLDFDNTLSLAVLSSQFPYSTGLKYKNPKNNQIRTVRRIDGKFFLSSDLSWDNFIFFCICPQSKRKLLQSPNEKLENTRKQETLKTIYLKFPETFDLIAIGLSFDTTEEEFGKYLNRFGKLIYCKLKFDEIFGHSRGQAYFRFKEIRSQNLCLGATHVVDKTRIIIKIPNEKINIKQSVSSKLFISNVAPTLTREDIRAYFSQYGQVIHVFMPPDKRCFAFVTFLDDRAIGRVMDDGLVHLFNGAKVNVSRVIDKRELLSPFYGRDGIYKNRKRKRSNEYHVDNKIHSKISASGQSDINSHHQYFDNHTLNNQWQSPPKPIFTPSNFSQPPPFHHPFQKPSLPIYVNPQTYPIINPISSFSNHPSSESTNSIPSSSSFSSNQRGPNALSHPNHQHNQYSISNTNRTPNHFPHSVNKFNSFDVHHGLGLSQSPLNWNNKSFQNLLVHEIIAQFHQQKNQRFPSLEQFEKTIFPSTGNVSSSKSAMNCSQLENLVSQVGLLNDEKFHLKYEKPSDPRKSEIETEISKIDWSILNDPKIHRVLELLQNSKLVDSILRWTKID